MNDFEKEILLKIEEIIDGHKEELLMLFKELLIKRELKIIDQTIDEVEEFDEFFSKDDILTTLGKMRRNVGE